MADDVGKLYQADERCLMECCGPSEQKEISVTVSNKTCISVPGI